MVGREKHFASVLSIVWKRLLLDSSVHLCSKKTGQYDKIEKSVFQFSLLVGMLIGLTFPGHESVRRDFRENSINERCPHLFLLPPTPLPHFSYCPTKARCNHWKFSRYLLQWGNFEKMKIRFLRIELWKNRSWVLDDPMKLYISSKLQFYMSGDYFLYCLSCWHLNLAANCKYLKSFKYLRSLDFTPRDTGLIYIGCCWDIGNFQSSPNDSNIQPSLIAISLKHFFFVPVSYYS